MADSVLNLENVSLGYEEEAILKHINLKVNRGELLVVAGTSGCGKSTLLKGAVGLLRPSQGQVQLFESALSDLEEEELLRLRTRVGFLFQGGALINSMSIAENIALPLAQFSTLSPQTIATIVRMKLSQVGLEAAEAKMPPELSGGMKKRAALARALALDPELLLCDEPSAGLDPVTAAGLDQLLLDLRRALDMTLIVVSHELGSIETIADRIVMIAKGSIVFDGSLQKAKVSEVPEVRNFFGRRASRLEKKGESVLQRFGRRQVR